MKTYNSFADLGKAFQGVKIWVELENVSPSTILGHAIHVGLKENKTGEIIRMVKDQAKDNYKAVENIVGKDLLKTIMNY